MARFVTFVNAGHLFVHQEMQTSQRSHFCDWFVIAIISLPPSSFDRRRQRYPSRYPLQLWCLCLSPQRGARPFVIATWSFSQTPELCPADRLFFLWEPSTGLVSRPTGPLDIHSRPQKFQRTSYVVLHALQSTSRHSSLSGRPPLPCCVDGVKIISSQTPHPRTPGSLLL